MKHVSLKVLFLCQPRKKNVPTIYGPEQIKFKFILPISSIAASKNFVQRMLFKDAY